MTSAQATIYATTDMPLGNGAFTADGRLVVSHHPMYGTPHRVSIFNADGSLSPYPNLAWNTPDDDPMSYLDAVLGLHDDRQGRIWLADMGTRSGIQPKFVIWDTRADALWRVIPLPPEVTTQYSEPNDFVVDESRGKVYIADEGAGGGGDGSRAALIVLDIASGTAERRLDGYDGIRAETGPLIVDGAPVARNLSDGSRTKMSVGVDGIAMDAHGEWLYLSPLTGHTIWRLRAADLIDTNLDDRALADRMECYAAKPNSGGMCIDTDGNLYLTVIERNAIGRIKASDRSYDEPVRRADMFWPDGIMFGPDGALYVVTTQLPRSPPLARMGEQPVRPFKVFRWDPQADVAGIIQGPSAIETATIGILAGLAAAAAASLFQLAIERFVLPPTKNAPPPPTDALATRAYRAATGRTLDDKTAHLAGTAIHYSLGAVLGFTYNMMAERHPSVSKAHGTAFGLGVWVMLEEVGLAAMRLKPPPWRVAASEHAFAASSHIVFGATLDTVSLLLRKQRPAGVSSRPTK